MRRTGRNGLIQKQILWLTNYGKFVYLKFDDTGISCATAMRACVSAEAGNFHSKVGCGHSVERESFPFTDCAIIGVNCLITIRCRDLQVEGGYSRRGSPGYNVFSKDNLIKGSILAKINIQPDGKIRVGGSPARTLRVDAVNH